MNPMKLLKLAGFEVMSSEGKPARWGVSVEVYERSRRLRDFIQEVLTANADRTGLLAARLVAIDAVPVMELTQIEEQACVPYQVDEHVALQWSPKNSKRIERRYLSRLSLQAWPSAALSGSTQTAVPAHGLKDDLQAFLKESAIHRSTKNRSEQFELDCLCWWHEILPPSLFAHISGLTVLSALPRSAWGRLESGLVPAATEQAREADADVGATGELIDAALQSSGDDKGTHLLQLALDCISEKHSPIDGVNKRAWAQRMLDLQNRALAAGPCTALLIAWVADLCENGTIQQSNPADTTIGLYTRRALLPLHGALAQMLRNLPNHDWSPTNLALVYEGLIASQSVGNRGTMQSGLACFHDFLVRHFDIEPLPRPLRSDAPEVVPHAQVVWPHEVNRTIEWSALHPDRQLAGAAELIIAIASEAPVRSQELFRVRIRSVRLTTDSRGLHAEIEIARDARSGRLKTLSSQRRLTLRNPSTLERLQAWISLRQQQGATADAYLFGDPNRTVNRYRPGATIAFVHRLLKATTGDPHVRLHSLRHTAITNAMAEIWRSSSCTDINPIEVLAAHAGHATPVTTLATYSHCPEAGMRLWLDLGMAEQIKLNHREVATIFNLKPDAVRARASRQRLTVTELGWLLIGALKVPTHFERAQDMFIWESAGPPEVEPRVQGEVGFDVVLAIVRNRLIHDLPLATLAQRHGLPVSSLERWEANLAQYAVQRAHTIHPRKFGAQPDNMPNVQTAIVMLDIDLPRLRQPKFQPLIDGLSKGQDERLMQEAITSWERCQRGVHISIEDGHQALDLLRLLRACGVDGRALRLCFQSPAGQIDGEQRLMRQLAADAFEAAYGIQPRSKDMPYSGARPAAYLQWDSSTAPGQEAGASGGSVAGLNAAMLVLKAHLMFKRWGALP
jgi:integrase